MNDFDNTWDHLMEPTQPVFERGPDDELDHGSGTGESWVEVQVKVPEGTVAAANALAPRVAECLHAAGFEVRTLGTGSGTVHSWDKPTGGIFVVLKVDWSKLPADATAFDPSSCMEFVSAFDYWEPATQEAERLGADTHEVVSVQLPEDMLKERGIATWRGRAY